MQWPSGEDKYILKWITIAVLSAKFYYILFKGHGKVHLCHYKYLHLHLQEELYLFFFFVIYTDGETGSLVPYFQFVMNFSDSRRSKWSVDYLPISYYGMHGMLHRWTVCKSSCQRTPVIFSGLFGSNVFSLGVRDHSKDI